MRPGGDLDSDGAMSRALAAGLPPEHLAVLMAARRHWWAQHQDVPAQLDPATADAAAVLWDGALAAALEHPAAAAFDEVFVAAARKDHPIR